MSRMARLRPEYVWPYPRLEADRWYPVREGAWGPVDPGWIWLQTDLHPVYVCLEHVEVTEVKDGARRSQVREARLRPEARPRYPQLRSGVWMKAREVVARVRPSVLRAGAVDRRRERLPEGDFEFRDRQPARR